MGGKSKAPPQITKGGPTYSPTQQRILGMERNLFESTILPAETQRIDALKNLIAGNFEGAESILSPAMSAAKQGQARLQASLSGLPANVSAPILDQAAWQMRGIPRRLQVSAPEELAKMTQSLMSPQFGSLMQPGSQSSTSGGGSSTLERNLAIAGTVATVAAIGIAI